MSGDLKQELARLIARLPVAALRRTRLADRGFWRVPKTF
jgi:hypothetical protein